MLRKTTTPLLAALLALFAAACSGTGPTEPEVRVQEAAVRADDEPPPPPPVPTDTVRRGGMLGSGS
ncbi:MAG TPA: hypothetical protein VFX98_14430 [Longimicrobiaceae bacterium]|nr:hypothetical protein [Longimicrobiaceae bacterium]